VRERLLDSFPVSGSILNGEDDRPGGLFMAEIAKTFADYFIRKKESKGPGYDPFLDLNMFTITMKGFALTYIYMENEDDSYYERTIDRIIEQFK